MQNGTYIFGSFLTASFPGFRLFIAIQVCYVEAVVAQIFGAHGGFLLVIFRKFQVMPPRMVLAFVETFGVLHAALAEQSFLAQFFSATPFFMTGQPTPPFLRAYEPLISLKALLNPYFWGGYVVARGGLVD